MINNSSVNREYKPETRNQHIKNMIKCPPSTPNRIVFLPKIDGVGFKCKYGKVASDGRLSDDQYELSRYSKELKDEVYSSIFTINSNCYNEWKRNKQRIQGNPMNSQNYQMMGLVLVCVIYIITFYIYYREDTQQFSIFYGYIIFIFLIIGFSIIVLIQVCSKKYHNHNIDLKMDNCIEENLAKFNKETQFGLKWVKLKDQYWIYVKIPEGAPRDYEYDYQ